MTTNGELKVGGLDQLAGTPEERILLVGFNLEASSEARALLSALPGAQRVSLDDDSKQVVKAGRAVGARACDVVIAVQNYRKLKLLTFASRARRRFVFTQGRLLPIDRSELVRLVAPPAQRAWQRARRKLEYPRVPDPIGAGNDFGFIEARANALPRGWPRIKASVIVPVYNRKGVLSKTLAALTLQTYPRELFEVVIADDGSSDHPEELIPIYQDRISLRSVWQEDLGYRLAEVRNRAIEAATGEVIISLDCDMLPEPAFLEGHLRWFHAAESRVVVIGYRTFVDTEQISPQDILQNFEIVRRLPETLAPAAVRDALRPTKDWRVPTFESTRFLRDHQVPYFLASGGNVAYRKREALAAGLYSPRYQKWGGEDVDFGYRMERLGCWFIAEPRALAYHQDHPSAFVREEDKLVTERILAARVPRMRSPEVAEPELPMTTVAIIDDGRDDARAAADSVRAHAKDLEILTVAGDHGGKLAAEVLDRARGEFLFIMRSNERLMPSAIDTLASTLRLDSRLAFVFGGVVAGNSKHVPRSYSRIAHLLGQYVPYRAMLRVRDIHRAGGFDATLPSLFELDLTLRMAEHGFGEAVDIPVLDSPLPRPPNVDEFEHVTNSAIGRLGLRWRLRGWPPAVDGAESRIDKVVLDARLKLASLFRGGRVATNRRV